MAEGGVGQARIGVDARRDHVEAQGDHPDDGCDLDRGEPEFELAERLDAHQIDGGDDEQHGGRRRPRRNRGKPILNVLADHREFGHRHGDVVEPIVPSGHKSRPGAPVVVGVAAERARARPMDRHLPHRPHHKENDDPAQGVSQKNRRAGQLDPLRRTVKQPRPNRPSEGDHLNVPGGQALAEAFGVFPGDDVVEGILAPGAGRRFGRSSEQSALPGTRAVVTVHRFLTSLDAPTHRRRRRGFAHGRA